MFEIVDYSLILSIFSLAVTILTAIYLLGYKLGAVETRIAELKDAINRLDAHFSPSWHEEYGRVKALVDQLSRTNYENIIKDLISHLHSSLDEVVKEIINRISPRLVINRCEIYEEKLHLDFALPEPSELREVTNIEEIKPNTRLFISLKAIIDETREIECIGLLHVDEKLVVRPGRVELLELSFQNPQSIPTIKTDKQASLFTKTSADEIRGYLDITVALIASVISYLVADRRREMAAKK